MIILSGMLFVIALLFIVPIGFIHLAPKKVTAIALNAERKRAGLIHKRIDLPDGLHFAYLEGGEGEPLMLLHGFGGNKDTFTRVARFLTKRYRVIIPDIIGCGESARPDQADYAPAVQVERLRVLSQALGVKHLHLGGNSMGAQIAMIYAALYPAEVKSLWLLSPAGVWSAPKSNVIKAIIETGKNQLIANNVEEFKQVMALGMRKPPYIPKPMLIVLAQERIENAALEAYMFQQLLDCSVEQQISGLETQTLIVFGDQDRIISVETAAILGKILSNSQVVVMKNVGHVPMFEKPTQCAQNYLLFREAM